MEMVTKVTHKSLKALQGTGHRNLSRRNQQVLDVLALYLNVLYVNTTLPRARAELRP